jgi:hypothetical protein
MHSLAVWEIEAGASSAAGEKDGKEGGSNAASTEEEDIIVCVAEALPYSPSTGGGGRIQLSSSSSLQHSQQGEGGGGSSGSGRLQIMAWSRKRIGLNDELIESIESESSHEVFLPGGMKPVAIEILSEPSGSGSSQHARALLMVAGIDADGQGVLLAIYRLQKCASGSGKVLSHLASCSRVDARSMSTNAAPSLATPLSSSFSSLSLPCVSGIFLAAGCFKFNLSSWDSDAEKAFRNRGCIVATVGIAHFGGGLNAVSISSGSPSVTSFVSVIPAPANVCKVCLSLSFSLSLQSFNSLSLASLPSFLPSFLQGLGLRCEEGW